MPRLKNIFDFVPETNITEEYAYNNRGIFPVFTGQTENDGIGEFVDFYKQKGELVTLTTYGSAGKLFYRKGKFTIGRNCMGLSLKPAYKEKISLEWFSYKFQNLFYRLRIGDLSGQRSLNRALIEETEIQILERKVQDQQLEIYKSANLFLKNITQKIYDLKKILRSSLEIEDFIHIGQLKKFFNINGGNSELTEQFIYSNLPTKEEDRVLILSGATQSSNSLGIISRYAKPSNAKLKIFRGPAILIIRKGLAGKMRYIAEGEFAINDDAYVLTVKNEWKSVIYLPCFIFQYQDLFFNLVTSKSANATFNKEYAERQKIKIISIPKQKELSWKLQMLDNLYERLENCRQKIEELLEFEIY